MSLESATMRLKKRNDEVESLQKARVTARGSIARLDALLGRGEVRRAIEAVLPKLAEVRDPMLRAELDLVLSAAREHLR